MSHVGRRRFLTDKDEPRNSDLASTAFSPLLLSWAWELWVSANTATAMEIRCIVWKAPEILKVEVDPGTIERDIVFLSFESYFRN